MLSQLKSASTIDRFAAALGYKPAALAFILFKMTDAEKYQTFTIAKASGGVRTIHAPTEKLKRLQKRLANVLADCRKEIHDKKPLSTLSHGFEPDRSIFTNAWAHKNRRYVLNLDLEDFFPTINFGRVRGYFINNRDFQLPIKAATLIAQIACFQGKLPQGSPSSPIISNLIAHLLDVRMARLAKSNTCTYSRYADDLTFSTNQKQFPPDIATQVPDEPGNWVLGNRLTGEIVRTGFTINHQKTRMQSRPSQQLVTGLTVNEKVNIRASYYRHARKMCSSFFNHGVYYNEMEFVFGVEGPRPKLIDTPSVLEGILSHIYHIKNLQLTRSTEPEELKQKSNKIKYPAYRHLYKKFLYFRHFINLDAPLIVCEGKTDNIYLRSALKALYPAFPVLADVKKGELRSKVKFLKHSRIEHNILELSGGSGNIANFIAHYRGAVYNYKYRSMKHPVIVLVDNDSGQKGSVFPQANKLNGKIDINYSSKEPFYHLCHNLYLIKTPEIGLTGESCMEDLFDAATLATKVDGKTFNRKDDKDTSTQYGKMVFADKVVRANYDKIDFSLFVPLLERITKVIAHYKSNPSASASSHVKS
ncbi:retron Ec67 family RNA-directed DNA polymerase/endonuclease [Methylobacterium tarhaniae]|uniref:retron Ec67 family RNA-directed DNA polymerase/endonuclease n=1 Tax=Methylobacterium tarhaniae TaxID=1187852 RepID=UPI0009F8FC30|nr:retron Ec67 family RNA-directed DNA polymerase/endonuclease [Methylobacterium tarhaniae]